MRKNKLYLYILCICGLLMIYSEAQAGFLIFAYRKSYLQRKQKELVELQRKLKDYSTLNEIFREKREQELASNESQLKLINAELESIKKAESDAAKACTPRFGLDEGINTKVVDNIKVTEISENVYVKERIKAEDLVKRYCDYLSAYARGENGKRILIEDLFGSNRNIVYNDLEGGDKTIEFSSYLNKVASNRPLLEYDLVLPLIGWKCIDDKENDRQLLIIEVSKEINKQRTSNVFYISIKKHPITGEMVVNIANIFKERSH